MSKNMPQYQKDALLVLRTRLNGSDPNNMASKEVKLHLRAIQLWIDSWVLPAVDVLESTPGVDKWMREAVSADARHIRAKTEDYDARLPR